MNLSILVSLGIRKYLRLSRTLLPLGLFLAIPSAWSQSALIKPEAKRFTTVGKLSSFQWVSPNLPQVASTSEVTSRTTGRAKDEESPSDRSFSDPFSYDVFYYIPRAVAAQATAPSLIFMHGGGGSTLDREGSIKAVFAYTDALVSLAEELGFVLVIPSANGLNWGGHTVGYLKEVRKLLLQELNVDADRIGLSGHSMGGMGITRAYVWMADLFSFFLPASAGTDVSTFNEAQIENWFNKTFNVPYIHVQGEYDNFPSFVPRCQFQEQKTKALEAKYGTPSKLKVVYTKEGHSIDFSGAYKQELRSALKLSRDLFQRELWGVILTRKQIITENAISFYASNTPRSFWVESLKPQDPNPAIAAETDRFNFRAKIVDQTISIDTSLHGSNAVAAPLTRGLRIYLKDGLVDLNRPVSIVINGKQAGDWSPAVNARTQPYRDPSDPGFVFDTYVDVNVPRDQPERRPLKFNRKVR